MARRNGLSKRLETWRDVLEEWVEETASEARKRAAGARKRAAGARRSTASAVGRAGKRARKALPDGKGWTNGLVKRDSAARKRRVRQAGGAAAGAAAVAGVGAGLLGARRLAQRRERERAWKDPVAGLFLRRLEAGSRPRMAAERSLRDAVVHELEVGYRGRPVFDRAVDQVVRRHADLDRAGRQRLHAETERLYALYEGIAIGAGAAH